MTVASLRSDGVGNTLVQGDQFTVDWVVTLSVESVVRFRGITSVENLYILSAVWGLIKADFQTPNYDITFSAQAESYKQRTKGATYRDISMLPDGNEEPILFFGGRPYVDLFCALTKHTKGKRVLWYNSKYRPKADGCAVRRFHPVEHKNWHYECAQTFIDGKLSI